MFWKLVFNRFLAGRLPAYRFIIYSILLGPPSLRICEAWLNRSLEPMQYERPDPVSFRHKRLSDALEQSKASADFLMALGEGPR